MEKHVGIIGKGMIGISWAVMFTGNGIGVKVLAKEPELGYKRYRTYYDDLVENGLVTKKQAEACENLLSFTQDYNELKDERIMFECVKEDIATKFEVYEKIEESCENLIAIGSSTSSISPDDLAKGVKHKEKILVAHPWNPPHLVPLVELVRNDYSDEKAIGALKEILEYAGRKVVMMNKPAPGFIGNRLQHALYREAVYMVEQGICTPEDIDKAIRYSFAPRYTSIGLFDHFDYAGLDMIKSIDDYLFPTLCNAETTQDLINERFNRGDLGYKTGIGVYDWRERDMDDFRKRASAPFLEFFNWKLPEEIEE